MAIRKIDADCYCFHFNMSLSRSKLAEYELAKDENAIEMEKKYQKYLKGMAKKRGIKFDSLFDPIFPLEGYYRKIPGGDSLEDFYVLSCDDKNGHYSEKITGRKDLRLIPSRPKIIANKHWGSNWCHFCQRWFYTTNVNQIYCSPECRRKKYIKRRKMKNIEKNIVDNPQILRICPICGEKFSGRSDKNTCNKYRCRKSFYRLNKKNKPIN